MNRIAIIPARSGSKGLPNKNIKKLNNKPLLAYTIEAAICSDVFSDVIVSSDSLEYGKIAKRYGASFALRSKELAKDSSPTYVVVEDIITKQKEKIDYFVLLQPTSPLRNSTNIIEACNLFEEKINDFNFLVSVKKSDHSKDLINIIEDDMSLKHFDKDFSNYRRQRYDYYEPNGAIFIAKPEEYLRKKHFFGSDSTSYIMKKEESIDIDDEIDFIIAEAILKARKK